MGVHNNSTTQVQLSLTCQDATKASGPLPLCVLLYIFLMLLSVITMRPSCHIIIAVLYFQQLHTPTNYLILSLAVADLLVGITVFPFSLAFSVISCLYHEGLFCKVRGSFDISLSTTSILNLCCISIDRYYAVCQPLTYNIRINHRVIVVMILLSWGVSALIGISVIIAGLNNEKCNERCLIDVLIENTVGPILSFYLPAIIMLCIYLKIFLVAKRQASRTQPVRTQRTLSGATVSKMERKATKTLAIVLGVFLLCQTPFFISPFCLSSMI
ncbi:trace amine-associated receptor 4-like [Epinephelus fuscoguttatus]|uniref:trace amine-associated receptor 4-like n=1 Tax=Epinephelus fuscoguttatus TaxID=293821 RepID=UPI0020CFF5FA|nr:trace amine-associated receptor 4-like [Epinephelus fuscoguttatus]